MDLSLILSFTIGATIIALGIVAAAVISAKSQEKYHIKPRVAFAQATVVGRTEESETMQLTASLFDDEPETTWNGKLNKLFEIREARLGFQNTRMQEIQQKHMEHVEAEKKKNLKTAES